MCWYLSTRFGNVTSRYVFPLVTGCAIRWACSAAVIASLVKFSRCSFGTPMQVNTRVRVALTSSALSPADDVRNRIFTVCACVSGVPMIHLFTSAFALARAADAVGSAAIELAADTACEDDEHPAAAGRASTAVIPAAVSMVLRFMNYLRCGYPAVRGGEERRIRRGRLISHASAYGRSCRKLCLRRGCETGQGNLNANPGETGTPWKVA